MLNTNLYVSRFAPINKLKTTFGRTTMTTSQELDRAQERADKAAAELRRTQAELRVTQVQCSSFTTNLSSIYSVYSTYIRIYISMHIYISECSLVSCLRKISCLCVRVLQTRFSIHELYTIYTNISRKLSTTLSTTASNSKLPFNSHIPLSHWWHNNNNNHTHTAHTFAPAKQSQLKKNLLNENL